MSSTHTASARHAQRVEDLVGRLVSRAGRANPFEIFEAFRQIGPVTELPWGAHLVTSYGLCEQVLRDHAHWIAVDASWRERHQDGWTGFSALRVAARTVVANNPPEHTRLRLPYRKDFSQRGLAQWSERIEQAVRSRVQALIESLGASAVTDYAEIIARPVPGAAMCAILGFPDEHQRFITQAGMDAGYTLELSPTRAQWSRANGGVQRLMTYLKGMLLKTPERLAADSPLLRYLSDHQDTERFEDLCSGISLVITAAQITTSGLLAGMIVALHRHPEQRNWLRQHPQHLDQAVDELLRYTSPAQLVTRAAADDLELGGIVIPRGRLVHLALAAAHRDPDFYADPHTLDLSRAGPSGLPFGSGIHYCLGAPIAKLEAADLLRRLPDLTVAEPPAYGDTVVTHSIERLLVLQRP